MSQAFQPSLNPLAPNEQDSPPHQHSSVSTAFLDPPSSSSSANQTKDRDQPPSGDIDGEHADKSNSKTSGVCFQLKVSLHRILIQLVREPVSLAIEVFIPLLFVLGSVIVWAVLANDAYPETNYLSQTTLTDSVGLLASLQATMCYQDDAISGLSACSSFSSDTLYCTTSNSGTPSGLCVLPSGISLASYGWRRIAQKSSAYIPDLDTLIALKWINRIAYANLDLDLIFFYTTRAAIYASAGTLFFAPEGKETDGLVEYFNTSSEYFSYIYGGTYSVAGAEQKVKQRKNTEAPIMGIIQVFSLASGSFNVQIRLNNTAFPQNTLSLNYVGGVPYLDSCQYLFSGFATFQQTVYKYYLENVQVTGMPSNVALAPMATVKYKSQTFLANAGSFVPLLLVFGFLYPVSQQTKRAVMEKELRLREAMLIMGLSRIVIYTSYFIIYFVQYTLLSFVIALLLIVTLASNSNFGAIFFLIWFFCLSLIALSGLIASCFSQARLASLIAPLIYFAMSIPTFVSSDNSNGTGSSSQAPFAILSPTALSLGLKLLFSHELSNGFKGGDMTYYNDDPNMLFILVMLFVDFIVYILLMYYLDQVLPQDWGTRRHPLFFIVDPIRACCCRGKEEEDTTEDGRAPDGVFEPGCTGEGSSIQICGLRKVFGSGKKKFVAVNNLYWSMKEGEISVLLGHNGAGKTTTMNMMTGMIEADGGDCFIYGKSVRHQLKEARKEIGYCPQHNILWPTLTCREHLWYFASIKGLRGAECEEAIQRMLEGVDLAEKANYRSSALSGGQKRKLSVAIAFVGGSKLVFLDEPTAGMDASARRHTWEMLRTLSRYHSILLTTHFMDEADLLGDTVAIMNKGRLQCSGSNMYLKSQLGVGYVLTLSVVSHAPREAIESMVKSFVPDAESLGCGGGEVAFRLPMASKGAFPALLAAVEDGSSLGINGFSISATTLEEIFIKIAEEESEEKEGTAVECRDGGDLHSSVWNIKLMEDSSALLVSQFVAMMKKRFSNALRDRRTQFFQIACPVICVLLAMLLTLLNIFNYDTTVLNSDVYKTNVLVDVAGCSSYMNADIPFSSRALTTSDPNGATDAAGLASYLLSTYYEHPHRRERYLGLACEDSSYSLVTSFVMHNASSSVSIPVGLYNLYNGYYQNTVGQNSELYTTSRSMPPTHSEEKLNDSVYAMLVALVVMIPFTFIPSTFVSWIVKEKQCKARHLQNASGLSFYVYWTSNFLFDICCYLITMFLVIIIFLCFNRTEFVGKDAFGATFLVFLLYGFSGIVLAYALSFLFSDYATAQNIVLLTNFITGFLLVLIVVMLQLIESTESVADGLRWVFRIVPSFCVGEGILNLAVLQLKQSLGSKRTALDMNVVGWPCVYMAVEFPLYTFLVLFIDHPGRRQKSQRLFHNADAPPEEIPDQDADVIAEAEEMMEPERQNDLVMVKNLRKVYGNGKVAVRNVTFGVKAGEVFGFLGTNGAGKTTTISILCQEFFPTSGHAKVCGHDIVDESTKALRCVGYCPQFDATIDLLTVEEHLYLYAGVRGIEYADRERVVDGLITLCELTAYRDKLSVKLSGGNRRKLSVALSLIGGPRVVFLDEPSAGMDPVARRGLWTAIQTVADNCAVVLTTHHLEEVEALAHRVAIMVDGTLKCIGNKTHLKTKYGSGFELSARLGSEDDATRAAAEDFITSNFPGSCLREFRAARLTYELPSSTKLSETFRMLEEHSQALKIIDYSVAQTSIEQVFLRISEEAELNRGDDDEKKPTSSCCCC